jgi:hypothetical protein
VVERLEKDRLVKISSTRGETRADDEERAAHGDERPEIPAFATMRIGLP